MAWWPSGLGRGLQILSRGFNSRPGLEVFARVAESGIRNGLKIRALYGLWVRVPPRAENFDYDYNDNHDLLGYIGICNCDGHGHSPVMVTVDYLILNFYEQERNKKQRVS